MVKSKELCKELHELEKKKEELVKKKETEMIKEGKAYACRKCSKVVVKNDATPAQLEMTMCYNCLLYQRKKEHKEAILNKIKFGKIVDLELDQWGWYENIKRLTVSKQGMIYELKAVEDEGEAYLLIDKEWQEAEPLEIVETEIKPWMKERKEKPLFEMKK